MTIDHWHTSVFTPDEHNRVIPIVSPGEDMADAIQFTINAVRIGFTELELTDDFLAPLRDALPEFGAGRIREMPFGPGIISLWSCDTGDPCMIGFNTEVLRVRDRLAAKGMRCIIPEAPEGWAPAIRP